MTIQILKTETIQSNDLAMSDVHVTHQLSNGILWLELLQENRRVYLTKEMVATLYKRLHMEISNG